MFVNFFYALCLLLCFENLLFTIHFNIFFLITKNISPNYNKFKNSPFVSLQFEKEQKLSAFDNVNIKYAQIIMIFINCL